MPQLPHVADSSTNNQYRNFDGSNMINFGKQVRRIDRRYSGSYTADHDRGGGTGIEFRPCNEKDESGVTSPPLWHVSPPKSPPTEFTPLHSQAYNHHHYRSLSPTSRIRAIERGKQELMEMVKTIPESYYELSLKDLVVEHKVHETRQPTTAVSGERELGNKESRMKKKEMNKFDRRQMSRSESLTDNRPVLLKMFCPVPLRSKNKKSSSAASNGKVSPRPVDGEKFADKDWWRRRLSVPGEREANGSGSSSGSSHSSRSRSKSSFLPGCWSFLMKSKSR